MFSIFLPFYPEMLITNGSRQSRRGVILSLVTPLIEDPTIMIEL